MKAVIMAGGEGTRLRPLTSNQPKPMMPIANRPMMEHIVGCSRTTASTTSWSPWPSRPTPSGPISATAPSSGSAWSTPPRRTRSAPPDRCATPWTSWTSRSWSFPATCSPISTWPPSSTSTGTKGAGDDRAQGHGEPARVRHRHHPRRRIHRALPGEAHLGPGLLRHHQHRHLRAGARGLRLHRAGEVRSTSPPTCSPACSTTGMPLFGYVAEGYWEDVGTLDAYIKAHQDVLDAQVALDIRASGWGTASGWGRDPRSIRPRPSTARPSSATTAGWRRAPAWPSTPCWDRTCGSGRTPSSSAPSSTTTSTWARGSASGARSSDAPATCAAAPAWRRASSSATSASSASTR